jgi:predicted RNA-binding protein YlxR (DUF448 family)
MKRVPLRTCIACRSVKSKREMVRVVRTPAGDIQVDETGKANGRGAYICRNRDCWNRVLGDSRRSGNGRLAAALHASLSEAEWSMLQDYAQRLPPAADMSPQGAEQETRGRLLHAL